jgi:hypothetical protein
MIYSNRIVRTISSEGAITMNITISIDVEGFTNNDDLVAWLIAALTGEPMKKKRNRKPMTEKQKAAFRERMARGRNDAAKAREKKEAEVRGKPTTKKPVTKQSEKKKKKGSSG